MISGEWLDRRLRLYLFIQNLAQLTKRIFKEDQSFNHSIKHDAFRLLINLDKLFELVNKLIGTILESYLRLLGCVFLYLV